MRERAPGPGTAAAADARRIQYDDERTRRHAERGEPWRHEAERAERDRDEVVGERPALVEALVNRQELAMPPTITADQVRGFSLYMIKAVLSGRGDELVELAKTNLFR